MATVKSTNLLIQRNEARISIKVPEQMKTMVGRYAKKINVSYSQYIKLAISERFEKEEQMK